jgi:predicted Zn-dependent protease
MTPAAAGAPLAELDAAEIRTLAGLGLWAAFDGQAAEALRLFEALGRLRPAAAFPRIGTAQALLASGRAGEAVRLLESAQAEHPDDDDVRALLGLALRVARRGAQERRVLAPLLADGDMRDTNAARLASRLASLALEAQP